MNPEDNSPTKYQVVRIIPEVAEIVIAETSTRDEAVEIFLSHHRDEISGNPSFQPKLKIKEI